MDVLLRTREDRSGLYAPSTTRAHPQRWLSAIVAVGAVVRLWGLGTSRLGYDESFTAMAGRMPLGAMFDYLRANDSHPPLDYLFHLPLARMGVDNFAYRLPSALCSITALALFAWWMRTRGRAGVLATAIFAVSAFLVLHGRVARGYAELELLGVAIAMLAAAWLAQPRRRHAPLLAGLLFLALLTHVSGFLLGAGLLVLAGRRRDREAWRWRAAVVVAGLGWATVWGSAFLVQSSGGHSDWIPRTTPTGLVQTVAHLASGSGRFGLATVAAVLAGGALLLRRRAPVDGRVWWSLFATMVGLAALLGFVLPVLLDRTLTLVAWGPALAVGVLLDTVWSKARVVGVVASVLLLVALAIPTVGVLTDHSGVTTGADHLLAVARPGDVVAVRPAGKLPEIEWNVGVQGTPAWRPVTINGLGSVSGIALGGHRSTHRVWVLDWNSRLQRAPGYVRCAPDWRFGRSRVVCLRASKPPVTVTPPT